MTTDLLPCTVYGDHETCNELRTGATAIASHANLEPIAWYADATGLRGLPGPASAAGLADALAHCAATGTPLVIPYTADAPGEQPLRLVAHWLDRRGLQLFTGAREYVWSRPNDELDFAMRRQLDAAADLALAVAVAVNMPDLDRLASELLQGPQPSHAAPEALRIGAACAVRGDDVPARPDPASPWKARHSAAQRYARWLSGHGTQHFVADVLNELGIRTRSGRMWTRSAVSRLISTRTDAVGQAA